MRPTAMPLPPPVERLRARLPQLTRRADALGLLLAALYALPTLLYPFGRDQGIFFYVGREWLAGRLPYVSAFDVKPPAVYLLHAASIALLGARQWSIRAFDVLAVLLGGWLVAHAVRRDGDGGGRPRPGEVGAGALLLSGFYFTCFDYWDTAQVEIWEGVLLLGSFVLARSRTLPPARAAVASGALAALATMLKFSAAVVALAPPAALALSALAAGGTRGERAGRAARAVLLYGAAGVGVVALFVGYFAAHGALGAVGEFLGYVKYYAANKTTPHDVEARWFREFWVDKAKVWVALSLGAWLLGLAFALRRRAREEVSSALWAMALLVLAVGSGCVQRKFWFYHWGVTAPFLALCAAHGVAELARRRPLAGLGASALAVAAGFALAPAWLSSNRAVTYRSYVASAWSYARGHSTRREFLAPFVGVWGYNYLDAEAVADAVAERARPGDLLHVRGFEPEIYAAAGLRSPSRFASEAPLNDPSLAFHRAEWLAQHERALWTTRPRFFVTFERTGDEATVASHGYHRLAARGQFVLMERNP